MKRIAIILSTAVMAALPMAALSADRQPSPASHQDSGKVVAETMVAANATVKALDKKKRTITLQLQDGREETFVVDKAVKKLGQVKVGDTVKVTYREAVSVKINKVKAPSGVKVEESVKAEEKSVKPAGRAGVRVTSTAIIDKVYDDGRMVALKMPDGSVADVKVRNRENREKLKKGEVKAGDQIEITFDRALALSVEETPTK